MTRISTFSLLLLGLFATACEENSAPGNDREAQISPPEQAAELVSLGEAIEGVGAALLLPQAMTDADLRNVPAEAKGCLFGYTRVSEPVFAYGGTGVLKVNDKLAPLPASGDGRYSAGDVAVFVRPIEEPRGGGEPFEAQLVLSLPGVDHERGFQGYSRCDEAVR